MKIIKIKIAAIIIFSVCLTTQIIHAQQPDTLTMPASEFKKHLEEKQGILVDVRTPEEYGKEHIKGSKNIDVKADDFESEINKLDKSKIYFIYCGVGKRGSLAMQKMHHAGFMKLYNLEGGLNGWKKEKFPFTDK